MSYRELKLLIKNNKEIGSFPLVETSENMILLGSIPRHHLMKEIERHTGRERRIQVASKWLSQAAARAKEELERQQFAVQRKHSEQKPPPQEEPRRRASRFEVTPVPSIVTSPASESSNSQNENSDVRNHNFNLCQLMTKSN